MNKRCIVNVATGEFYMNLQGRLLESLQMSVDDIEIHYNDGSIFQIPLASIDDKNGIDMMLWQDCLPPGSRPHSESPYGFKVHAIKAAYDKGYTSILWLDSPAYAVKEDISPIFEKIEKEGYYAMSHIDPLENWVGDKALDMYNMEREMLKGYNLPSGSCYGFDMTNELTEGMFDMLAGSEAQGLFQSEKISETGWHRHDEAILALELRHWHRPIFTFDPLFQSDSPECVIKSGEMI
jgi:hypothetical protein